MAGTAPVTGAASPGELPPTGAYRAESPQVPAGQLPGPPVYGGEPSVPPARETSGWSLPFGHTEHPLLRSNPAADYRKRNVAAATAPADPRYGAAPDGMASDDAAWAGDPTARAVQTQATPPSRPMAGVSNGPMVSQGGAAAAGLQSQGELPKPERNSPQELLRELLNINGDRCLATVGPEVILLSEILPEVDKLLEPYLDKVPEDVLETQRVALIQKLLAQHIDIKLLLVDIKNKVPKENLPKLREQFIEPFEEKEIPNLLSQFEVTNRGELDQAMRAQGISLVQYRQQFIDRTMAGTWARQQIKNEKEITHQAMVDYYRAHLADFEFPAKARWEQLTVEFSGSRSKEEAYRRIAMLGNMVLDGVPFAEVARQHSDGPTASDGGQRDWTTKNSLVCEALDRALFELPVGQLSPIIEDRQSFHIIRVQERQAAGRVEFLEAQTEIRKKLQTEDRSEQVRQYIDNLRKEINVWTIFDQFTEDVAQDKPRTIY